MHGRLFTVDQHRENSLITMRQSLDHDSEKLAKLIDAISLYCHRAGNAGPGDLKLGIRRKGGADAVEISAQSCGVQIIEQLFGPEPVRHGAPLWACFYTTHARRSGPATGNRQTGLAGIVSERCPRNRR